MLVLVLRVFDVNLGKVKNLHTCRSKLNNTSFVGYLKIYIIYILYQYVTFLNKFSRYVTNVIIYIYHMASRVTYQNISPEATRKPWRVVSPDAEGQGFRITDEQIFW